MSLVLDLPLRGSQLIEASAGTGKTFTIALLYVRLVLGHGNPEDDSHPRDNGFQRQLTPPEILVVTFTEAATQELKSRIRDRLVDAASAFREAPETADLTSADPLLALRNEYPPERWKSCARRLQMAAEWMDDAAVSTIHAWCYKMLIEHAFDSGNLFKQNLISDQSDLITEAVQDYWRARFYPMSPTMAPLVYEEFDRLDKFEEALRPLLKREDARLEYGEVPVAPGALTDKLGVASASTQQANKAEHQARQAYRDDRGTVRDYLAALRPGMNGNSFRGKADDAVFEGWLEELDAWADGAKASGFIGKLGADSMKLNRGHQVPDHPFFALVEEWQGARQTVPDLRPHILADAREWVLDRLQRQLRERAEMGFDDLLKRLDEALSGINGDALAERIRDQFPVAMIDEFQDTDPLQYRIFETVYRVSTNDEETCITLIGDPKQAIYSFRGADIRTYLAAKADTEGRHHTLGKNFRSSEGMINAVNGFFSHADGHPSGVFRFATETGNPLPFQPVAAKGRDEVLELDGALAPAFNVWWYRGGDFVRPPEYMQTLAEHAAEQLSGWLHQAKEGRAGFRRGEQLEPLKASDIAILVRDRKEAALIRKALSRRQLPSVYLSDRDSVFGSDEARDVLYWLQACAEPDNDSLVRTALATPTLALSLATLDHLNQSELAWEGYQDRFHQYRHYWQKTGPLPMLRLFMQEFDLAERLLGVEGGERSLTNLLHLAEWAQQASEKLDGEQALIRELAEHISQPGGEEQILRLESDADLIKVVTIHKSKGLEYPLVMLPFIANWVEVSSRKDPPVYHKDGMVFELAKKKEAETAHKAADDERLSEDMRQLYVALTRAQHATFLGLTPLASTQSKKPMIHRASIGYALNGGKPFPNHEDMEAALTSMIDSMEQASLALVPDEIACTRSPKAESPGTFVPASQPSHAPFRRWWISSYTAIVERGDTVAAPDTADEATQADEAHATGVALSDGEPAPGSIHAFPRGPEAGTFLHGLLEWAGEQGFAEVLARPEERHRLIERRCLLRGWADYAPGLDAWLTALLEMPLLAEVPTLQPAALPPTAYLIEQDFWFEAHEVATPVLDRLISADTLDGIARPPLGYNVLNGMLKGFIDLVTEHDGRYYVIDWKSNWLGPDPSHYTRAAMRQSMREKRHDVQLCLYVLALHRHLRLRLPDYDYDRHLGGALYVFLRGAGEPGAGVYHEKPPRQLIESLDALFSGESTARATTTDKERA